jgi:Fe-S-cluster-containing hydrogenase component 2
MNINVEDSSTLNNPECINCSECVNVCPVKNTLNISVGNKFKISFLASLIVVIAIFFGSTAFASITGQFKWWQGGGKHLEAQATVSPCCNINDEIQSFSGCIEENYQNKSTCNERFTLNLDSIKGNITLSEAIKLSNIPIKSFIEEYSFNEKEMSLTLKEVMERRGLSVLEFKEFIKSKLSQ